MTQEEKQELIVALCGYLLYGGVMVEYDYGDGIKRATNFHGNYLYLLQTGKLQWKGFRPYLRPMSSMNDLERDLFYKLNGWMSEETPHTVEAFDWLNENKFDYREDKNGKTMIERGIALEAPKGMYGDE